MHQPKHKRIKNITLNKVNGLSSPNNTFSSLSTISLTDYFWKILDYLFFLFYTTKGKQINYQRRLLCTSSYHVGQDIVAMARHPLLSDGVMEFGSILGSTDGKL